MFCTFYTLFLFIFWTNECSLSCYQSTKLSASCLYVEGNNGTICSMLSLFFFFLSKHAVHVSFHQRSPVIHQLQGLLSSFLVLCALKFYFGQRNKALFRKKMSCVKQTGRNASLKGHSFLFFQFSFLSLSVYYSSHTTDRMSFQVRNKESL